MGPLIKKNISYYTCYLSFYKNRRLLYLNEYFLYDKDNKTSYYYKKKVIKVI